MTMQDSSQDCKKHLLNEWTNLKFTKDEVDALNNKGTAAELIVHFEYVSNYLIC
jgi:hypothetical protein